MIYIIEPLDVGNALKVFLAPPDGALRWRLLRKGYDTFTGHDDDEALEVYEGDEKVIIDSQFVQNEVPYFYCAYYWDGSDWTASNTATGTARANYSDGSTDAQVFVRDRLDYGLQEEVRRNTLRPQSRSIPVLTAPPVFEDARWPMVSVSLLSDGPAERGLGEFIEPDEYDLDLEDWSDNEGWLARVQLSIVGWSQNPDERIALRQALRRLIVANLPIFENVGITQVEFLQQDVDAVSGEYPAPVYQTAGTFTCLAPVIVGGRTPAVREVIYRSIVHGDEA